MHTATKEPQALQQGYGQGFRNVPLRRPSVSHHRLAQDVVIANAAPLSDRLCGSSSYHFTTAYLLVIEH